MENNLISKIAFLQDANGIGVARQFNIKNPAQLACLILAIEGELSKLKEEYKKMTHREVKKE